jgi:O-antigen/teichoic acid export membrane protein
MSLEGPYLAAIIARLAEPKFNLAAYGVAFSFALIIEAPVIMMMSASTALVKDFNSYKKLGNFNFAVSSLITVIMLIILIPSIFDFIAIDLIKLTPEVEELTYKAFFVLLPWPGAIGYRRFYQGIMIRHNLTKRVAYGTIVRLLSMSITALVLYLYSKLDGAVIGAAALSVGVTIEAIASRIMAHQIVTRLKNEKLNNDDLTYKEMFEFYYPLALTSLIGLGVHPMVTFFIGQSRMSIESLAVLPVINSLVFIFRSLGLSFQEVGIALVGEKGENFKRLADFAMKLGIILAGILLMIALTPISKFWFFNVSGLSETLTEFVRIPVIIIAIMPLLTVIISFQRAMLVSFKKTSPVTIATVIEVSVIILTLFVSIKLFDLTGVTAAMIAFIIGRLSSIAYLSFPFKRIKNSF